MAKMTITQNGISTDYYSENDIKEAIVKAISYNFDEPKGKRAVEIVAQHIGAINLMNLFK